MRGIELPIGFDGHSIKSIDALTKEICYMRENEHYSHENCTDACKVNYNNLICN